MQNRVNTNKLITKTAAQLSKNPHIHTTHITKLIRTHTHTNTHPHIKTTTVQDTHQIK